MTLLPVPPGLAVFYVFNLNKQFSEHIMVPSIVITVAKESKGRMNRE